MAAPPLSAGAENETLVLWPAGAVALPIVGASGIDAGTLIVLDATDAGELPTLLVARAVHV